MASKKFDYLRAQNTAKRLLDKFGVKETIIGYEPGTVDPAQPNRPAVRTPKTASVTAVFLNYELSKIDGTSIKHGDMRVLISPKDATFDPQFEGTITKTGDGVWSIVGPIKVLNPGGVKLLYTLQVRR